MITANIIKLTEVWHTTFAGLPAAATRNTADVYVNMDNVLAFRWQPDNQWTALTFASEVLFVLETPEQILHADERGAISETSADSP